MPIRKFGQTNVAVVEDRPRADRLVSGNPRRLTQTEFAAGAGQGNGEITAGQWSCEVGAWNIEFAANRDEFFHVLSGRIRLRDRDGLTTEIGAGESAVIPAGFSGVFEVIEPVVKHFVLVDRRVVPKPARAAGAHP
jgi:uncharacterized protein